MKKIISGKKYDTETATEIAFNSNGLSDRDFRHYAESLYQKKSGEFFLHGEGGPLSAYAEKCSHGISGSEKIIPLTIDEAKVWLEENGSVEAYEDIFGEVAE